jgi:diacylglycerol kinase (ATP)
MTRSCDLAIVLNPASGEDRTDDRRLKGLRALAGSRAVIFATDQQDLVEAVAEGVRERGVDTVAVIGGDGTISYVLSALARAFRGARLPRIALLRGGTMNTTANGFGVPRRKPEELLRRLLASGRGPSVRRATISIEGRLGFLFSTGAMVGFLDVLYEARARKQGTRRALSLLARGSWEALTGGELIERIEKPLLASVRVDGIEHLLRSYTLLAAGTFERIGLGFRPFPRAVNPEGGFQTFAFHASLQALARQLPRIRRGLPLPAELGFDPLARRLEIRTHGERIRYALDGDIYRAESDNLIVETGPEIEVRMP